MSISATSTVPSSVLQEIQQDLREMRGEETNAGGGSGSFLGILQNSVGQVNQMLNEADRKSVDLASGKSDNIHDVMISVEKAEAALKMMMQTRNKALEAYHEILKMQL